MGAISVVGYKRPTGARAEYVGEAFDHLFFVFSKNRGVAIPRRAFAGAEDYHAALDTQHRHLPDLKIGALE